MDNLPNNLEIPLHLESSMLLQLSHQTLITMNDDCLFELFKHFTDIEDLLEIGSTCKRFLGIAQQAFRYQFKKSYHFDQMTNWPIKKVERYLQHFGEFCETFDSGVLCNNQAEVLLLLTKHCKNLRNLRCNKSGRIASSQLKSSFSKLVQLENHLGLFNGTQLFDENASLQKLSLINCEVRLPEQHLPQLQHVKLELTDVYPFNLDNFFYQNKQLIRLELCGVRYFLEDAIRHLENLEELKYCIECCFTSFDCFENLKKLKKLSLSAYNSHLCEILNALHKANAPLEFIMLDDYNYKPSIVEAISQFQSIKQVVLKKKDSCWLKNGIFYLPENAERLYHLVERMPQLEHITCDLNMFTMEAIRIMLQHSQNLRSAFFTIHTSEYKSDTSKLKAISAIARDRKIRVEIRVWVSTTNMFIDSSALC